MFKYPPQYDAIFINSKIDAPCFAEIKKASARKSLCGGESRRTGVFY